LVSEGILMFSNGSYGLFMISERSSIDITCPKGVQLVQVNGFFDFQVNWSRLFLKKTQLITYWYLITLVSDGIAMFFNGSHGFFVTPGGLTLKKPVLRDFICK
jgi:hypothetical protein